MGKFKYKTEPWKHQKKALSYLYKRDAAALYTDMGTGKTKVMIDLIQSRDFKRVLVVAPKKACDVWVKQIAIHGLEGKFVVYPCQNLSKVKVIDLLDSIPKWRKNGTQEQTYVFIINYEKVWDKGIEKYFSRKTFHLDCIICDESHRIKSPMSNCSMCLARLGKLVPHRYLVTGTPIAENPTDVFAQYKFLDPSIFGTVLGTFRDEYENLDVRMTLKVGHRILDKKHPYRNLEQLHDKMFSCAFYIHSSVELPEQTDITVEFDMPEKTIKLYDTFIEEKVYKMGKDLYLKTDNVLTRVLRCQQMTSGYAQVQNIETKEKKILNVDKARFMAFKNLAEDFPVDEPFVVFCTFKKDIKNVRKACRELEMSFSELHGSKDTLEDWLEGKTQVLIVQYTSGSESIDLTRAHYCVYYSLNHRLALYEQSRKRIHRPGQTKACVYYHLIEKKKPTKVSKITMDEKIYAALKLKMSIAEYIMEKGWE